MESARLAQELAEWYRGWLKITRAIQRQLDELEARRAGSTDNAALDDEIQRLRQNLLAEYARTHRLWTARHGELNQDHARAVWEWQRSRRVLLAMALSAVVLAGWLFRQARLRHREQVFVERAAGADRRRSAERRAEKGDPQWSQKLAFLAMWTIWLFFGSIDWSDWNAIKDRIPSRPSPVDDEQPPDSTAAG